MNDLSMWEKIFLVVMIAGTAFLFLPSAIRSIKENKDAPKDWAGFLIPIALIAGFVFLLIQLI